ncbi:E3 ubiquitin-protein ligase TRIM36-like [Saccostrea cucullata]|uniref:E3 ubiquitin-protein ligase TRIM36-like n=1 Tax=Saccostrea cuccullata TaxID=36930 RepID=UPI002ED2B132
MDPQRSAQDVIRCDLCETAVVQMHCDFCDVNLCIPCIGRHISDGYDKHKVVPFEERKTTLVFPRCTIHPTKSCELQCKECNIPVCLLCSVSIQHKNHDLLVLSEMLDAKKESLTNDTKEIENNLLPTYESLAMDIETQMTSLDGDYVNLTELVTKHGEEWHKEIDRIVDEMKKEINEMKDKHKSILKQHLCKIKETQSLMDQTLLTLKEIEESNKVILALEYTPKIKEFGKLLPKVQISIPKFTTGNLNREQIYKLFGSLSPLSITKEEGYGLKEMVATSKILLESPELITSISTGFNRINGVTCLSEEEIWICGTTDDLKCLNIQGSVKKTVQTKSGKSSNDITLTGDEDLVYSDGPTRTVNKVRNGQIEEMFTLQRWVPKQLCSTASGDLMVTMYSDDKIQSKVVRYTDSTEKQTIQFDEQGKPLFSGNACTKYIRENRNLDICVADFGAGAVVVVNQAGKLRFRYTGHIFTTKKKSFKPWGITTDSQCQILTSDYYNNCIHILDQNGQFLRYIDNWDLKEPTCLCVDKSDNLFVAEDRRSGNLKKIKYAR